MIWNFLCRYLLLCALLPGLLQELSAQDTLIRNGDEWLFWDHSYYPGHDWTEMYFPTEGWKRGRTPIGHNYPELVTKIDPGDTTAMDKKITTYYKCFFDVPEDSEYLAYKISYKRDDGCIFYLNNQEVYRSNMPDEPVDFRTNALSVIRREEERLVLTQYLEAHHFRKGKNVLAISLHQLFGSSMDAIIALDLIGIKDEKELNQFLKSESLDVENDKILLIDKKHELSAEKIKNEFNENLQLIQWGVILFLLGILFVGAVLFLRYHRSTLKNKEKQQHKADEIQNQLKTKEEEMISYSLATMRNRSFLKELKSDIIALLMKGKDNKTEVQKLIHRIDTEYEGENEWEKMKLHFNAVFDGFFERLKTKYPELSEQDLRHCSFIRMHLDTKEISQILRIDPKSVQASRYRLKKKFNLPEQQNLYDFIAGF